MGLPQRVLVVDDTAFMRMMLREILQGNDYEVVGEASSGEEALRLYGGLKPDLVTLDITMPGMDGVDTVKALRQKDKAVRIVMVSAMGQKDMIIKAIQAGARDFIVKPFERTRVLEALKRVSQHPTEDDPKA